MAEELIFDSIIEGTYHDSWFKSHYKIALLKIPLDKNVVDDGTYRYILNNKSRESGENLHSLDNYLGILVGIVLPYIGGSFPEALERTRSIITIDGRVFVAEDMIKHNWYMNELENIAEKAKDIFNKRESVIKEIEDTYKLISKPSFQNN